MTLNHINLTVPDVAKSRDFFVNYFGFKSVADRGRDVLAILVDDARLVLTLNNFGKTAEVTYPDAFHIGFMLDSREKVDAMYERLHADGFADSPPREFHGAWTFYFTAPGGFTIEVQHMNFKG